MSMNHDPDLDDILQDAELIRLARLMSATRRAEPPLDEAFRSDLRRKLMQRAWGMDEQRAPWWQRLTGPPALAWAGAALGVLLIGSVVVFTANQPPGVNQLTVTSPIADSHAVQLGQPILVSFNQPMNHPSTEKAVQITPATYVAFSWSDNTLAVHPTGGTLAPNTQYRVTIGPGATTAKGQPLSTPKTITFVTQPSAPPPPSPTPTIQATPTSHLGGDHRLAAKPSGAFYTPQWSADSTIVYFVGDNGALASVSAAGGDVKVIVPDGVSLPAIAPTGDRLAYLRGGKIEMLTLAGGSTSDLAEAPQVTALSWAKDQILWATNEGIFTVGADGQSQLASIPQNATVVSIAPDGGHAVYQEGQSLHVLDLATSRSRGLGGAAAFLGWSPDGSRMLYAGNQETVVADAQGQKIASILSGDVSWSSKDEILIGDDTDLYAVRPDGYGRTLLNSGTYRNPVWAPDGVTFTYVRGGAIWSATTAPLPLEPPALDQAASVVSQFMNARIAKHGDQAQAFLDNKGKQAYSSSGLPLVITGDATFTRDYVVVQQMTDLQAQTARFVVRLVLSKGSLDVSEFEETLTLKRDDASQPFLIDQAGANSTRDLGKGAEVVSADVATGSMKVVFDSDLVADTVADGVVVLDANGKRVGSPSTYANRTVVITGLDLAPGASYKLVVLTSVQDVSGRNVAAEYDLNVVGPAQASSPTAPSPEPSPEPTPSPSPSPSA
ncbi:MAG TPA: Ig-like domain-containing protein [Candidatus Dormibacteraeota bacterium]